MAQDTGTCLRTETSFPSKDAHLLAGVEHPGLHRLATRACVLRDTTLMLLRPLAGARTASSEADGTHNPRTKARPSLARNVLLSDLEGNKH